MKKYRVIIAGSRSCSEDCTKLKDKINKIMFNMDPYDTEIVSGTCKGGDILGENYAKDNGIDIVQFPADWKQYGKKAGYLRNEQMAEYGTHLIALWDGNSNGTKNMIKQAKEKGLPTRIIKI